MNDNSVQKNIFKNGVTAGITFISSILMKFIVRTFFVTYLGERYLGLNGVFSSIIQMLSLTDLGMEAAFAFVLYRPIANDNKDEIFKIVKNLKKIYEIVGILVLIIGLSIVPFLKEIIGIQNQHLDNVLSIYFIFLANAVSSYFFTYNRTLLNADQRNYVVILISFCITTLGNLFQIITLVNFKSPVLFYTIELLMTITTNLFINLSVKRYYPFMFEPFDREKIKLSSHTKKKLIKNSIGGLSNKIGSIIVFASDNVLISIFVGLSTVGFYTNYTMITNSVSGFVSRIIQPMTASIGNISVKKPKDSINLFEKFNMITWIVVLFIIPQILILINPFIQWWIGDKYVLNSITTALIVFNLALQISRQPALTFIDAYGLQWIQKWKSIGESAINIILSLSFVLLFHMGLNGILLGTICSTLFSVSWYEPYVVFRYGFYNVKLIIKFALKSIKGMLIVVLAVVLDWNLTRNIAGRGLLYLMTLSSIIFLVSASCYILFYLKYKGIKNMIYGLLK